MNKGAIGYLKCDEIIREASRLHLNLVMDLVHVDRRLCEINLEQSVMDFNNGN